MPKDTSKAAVPPRSRQLGPNYQPSLPAYNPPTQILFAPIMNTLPLPPIQELNEEPLPNMETPIPQQAQAASVNTVTESMHTYYQIYDPQMQAPSSILNAGAGSAVPNSWALEPMVPAEPRPEFQFQSQPQIQDRLQTVPGEQFPPVFTSTLTDTVAPDTQTWGSLGLTTVENPPQPSNRNHTLKPLLELEPIIQFTGPEGIWPLKMQTRLESGLHNKVLDHPQAQIPLQSIEICLISTAFKIGVDKRDGFRWAALLLPQVPRDPAPDPILHLPSPNQQCAWLLDPCARMEGREFLQFLDPETLMLRRKLHLRPIIEAYCEPELSTEKMIWRMENWYQDWTNVLCCSVMGATEPDSLALGTGLWITALYQVVYSRIELDNNDNGTGASTTRNLLATQLESIGSRELGLPFLHPRRSGLQLEGA